MIALGERDGLQGMATAACAQSAGAASDAVAGARFPNLGAKVAHGAVGEPAVGADNRGELGASIDLQHDVDDVLQGHVVDAGTDIDAVAGVKAHFVRRDIPQGVVQHLHA